MPALWRPIAGIDAFDLRSEVVDVTAFLPLLSDGKTHDFEIKIAGLDAFGRVTDTVGDNWVVSGALFLWLDEDEEAVTTGSLPVVAQEKPAVVQRQWVWRDEKGLNVSLDYSTMVGLRFGMEAVVRSQKGARRVGWEQKMRFVHESRFEERGERQLVEFWSGSESVATGGEFSAADENDVLDGVALRPQMQSQARGTMQEKAQKNSPTPPYNFTISNVYSLITDTNMTFYPEEHSNLTISATLSMHAQTKISNSVPGTTLRLGEEAGSFSDATVGGRGFYFADPKAKKGSSFGRTGVILRSGGVVGNGEGEGCRKGYERKVEAVNGTVVADKEVFEGKVRKNVGGGEVMLVNVGEGGREVEAHNDGWVWERSARRILGRGPG